MIRAEYHSPLPGPSVYVVDDHRHSRESMVEILRCAGYEMTGFPSAEAALEIIADRPCDVLISDLQMPGMNGLEFIARLREMNCRATVIMATAYASVSTAVEAMRLGAFDYLEKPFDADKLERIVARAAEQNAVQSARQNSSLLFGEMLGRSRVMQEFSARLRQIAASDETVLITGESGSGKELAARAIHAASRRANDPLVCVNCPVLSAQLLESELFGHTRGAFTGADAPRTGRFEAANGGSIFLDEITELEYGLQAKLLRVLQEKRFERVGSSETIHADVRVLAATNRDLKAEVAAGRFREDLFFRLHVLPAEVPPLRRREEDILLLAESFLHRAAERLGRSSMRLHEDALDLLQEYSWPGNIRELQNVMTQACVMATNDIISAADIQPALLFADRCANSVGPTSLEEQSASDISLQAMERRLIESTLERHHGHRGKTAQALGIGLRTLTSKLKEYGLTRSAPSEKCSAKTKGDRHVSLAR